MVLRIQFRVIAPAAAPEPPPAPLTAKDQICASIIASLVASPSPSSARLTEPSSSPSPNVLISVLTTTFLPAVIVSSSPAPLSSIYAVRSVRISLTAIAPAPAALPPPAPAPATIIINGFAVASIMTSRPALTTDSSPTEACTIFRIKLIDKEPPTAN